MPPPRFARVDQNLLRGGAPAPAEIPVLRDRYGIRKIVSLDGPIGNSIDKACQDAGVEHIIMGLTDGNGSLVPNLPGEVVQWANGGPTYVHCRHGKDRTGMACAMYRVLVNGWDINSALQEANSFGMGKGLPNGQSYYDAVVRHCSSEDSNHSDDIVSLQRDQQEFRLPVPRTEKFTGSPFTDDPSTLMHQESFAPQLDVQNDYLNRPASSRRLKQIRRFAQMFGGGSLFKYCKPSEALQQNTIWYSSVPEAKKMAEGDLEDANLYSANIENNANIISYNQEMTQTLIHIAAIKGGDVVVFKSVNGPVEYFVINPYVLKDVRQLNSKDTNFVPMIGLHDNYEGAASWVFPGSGSGGSMVPGNGSGGFAGFVQLPFGKNV